MRIQYLSSTAGEPGRSMFQTTYLVNDTFAIDAGVLGNWRSPAEQSRIADVVLTHSHLDHVGTLPMFLDNTYGLTRRPVRVYMSDPTRESLTKHVFNGEQWADLSVLLSANPPIIEMLPLSAGTSVRIGDVDVLPVTVHHSVPSLGMVLTDSLGSVAISSDTGPADEFWEACRAAPNLQAVFLECSFPSEFDRLAEVSCHLTPKLLAQEVAKLGRPIRVIAMHLKPGKEEVISRELAAIDFPTIEVVRPGETYDFGG